MVEQEFITFGALSGEALRSDTLTVRVALSKQEKVMADAAQSGEA